MVIGTPVAGRTRLETEGLIGFFANTLVLRTELSGGLSFGELLRRVREATLGAYQHQDLPFEKLVEELAPQRSLSHTPLFQVLFALQNAERSALELGSLGVERLGTGQGGARFDLNLNLGERSEGLRGSLTYRAELWEGRTMERLVGHFGALLEAAVAEPQRPVSELPMLSAAERTQLLEGWNDTAVDHGAWLPLHARITARAARTPDALAVVAGAEQLTYAELERRSTRLAHALRARGVGPETRVGVYLARGAELVVALLAVHKAGAAYLPLDPAYPRERLEYMLRDSGAGLLLSETALAGTLACEGVPVVCLDAERDSLAAQSTAALEVPVHAESLAYVIYTSGSTGRPKGVMNTQGALLNLLLSLGHEVQIRREDVLLGVTPLSFDIAALEVFLPLLSGARLVVADRESAADGARLLRAMEGAGVTLMQATPATWHLLLGAGWAGDERLRVLCGGEALAPELAGELRGRAGAVWNVYGPTETTIWSTAARVSRVETPVPVGEALANTRVYVLDAQQQPVPVGVRGALWIGGAGLARGYAGRADLTAERFRPDPYAAEPGARMYETGDVGRRQYEGRLEVLGRGDGQVKVRGYRIEVGEIEAALEEHGGVRQAVVAAWGEGVERRLVAYVVAEGEAPAAAAELRAHLRASLPEYMVPAAFVALEELPLTPNGKVDRRALPVPELSSGEGAYEAPRSVTEELLAEIWAEVLRADRVGVGESFFELGGHSLLATRVVSRVREAFGVELPLRALFEAPTVAGLAERIDGLLRDGAGQAMPPLVPVSREGALPLSFAQQRLWFLDQLEPGSAAYNMPTALRLRGRLNVRAMQAALSGVARRHEVLRTVFATEGGEPVQWIAAPALVPLPFIDLAGLPNAVRESELRRLARAEASRPFNLARGPLLRATLLGLGGEEHALLFTLHHIISDGWSTGVLVREVSEFYTAEMQGRAPVLPELPVQYADYAAWQRAWLRGEVLEAQLAYWRERLADAPPVLELPTDRPRPRVASERAGSQPVRLSSETSHALRALGRAEGVTLFMTLLSAWQLLLARYSGQDDLVVGTPIAGRTRLETEPLIGFFANTLVLRTDLSGNLSFQELLGRVREATLGAYQHQDLPFEKLVEELAPERSLSHTPLFQVLFAMQNAERSALELGGLEVERLGTGDGGAKFDLSLTLGERGEGLRGSLAYRAELWEGRTMERLAGHLGALLEAAVARPGRPVGELPLLGAAERAQVLEEWNETARDFPAGCIHELFAAQAARTPDAPAMLFADQTLTYGELERRATRLANHLRARGVGPETRVGICLERSPELVVALLSVLKAGGAYVPLDPAYPSERLRFMLRDSAAPLLLAETRTAAAFAGPGAEILLLDVDREHFAAESEVAPRCGVLPENLAYVIYTSGSTGTPKGVLVPHRGLCNVAAAQARRLGLGAGDRVLQFASASFDASFAEMVMALANGGTLCLGTREELAPGPDLVGLLRAQGVTVVTLPPSALAELPPADLPALRILAVAGEACPAELVDRWAPGRAFLNLYGPTEATIWSTMAVCVPGGGRPAIGQPIDNTRAYVLDARLEPAPVGVPGELCVGGSGVARGYGGRPDLTAERFVPDGLSGDAGARLYRTGDRVRWLATGQLEYLGRTDFQVKVRGYRIEPGEIETVLGRHPAVREAVVLAREDAPGERRLVAYVGAAEAVPAAELRAHLRESLPEYMVPSALVVLEALPISPNGKVDRRALPAPEPGGGEAEYEAPRSVTEELLAEIWAEVLRAERVGIRDSFFELGGHSLLATRVVSRVREAFGVELPLRALFEAPTVAGLAERVDALRRDGAGQMVPPLVPVSREGALPLSFAQQRLWFLDQLEPGSAAYNMPAALRLRGCLDVGAMQAALTGVARRHGTLRTVFATESGEPVQRIAVPAPVPLPFIDLAGLPDAVRVSELRRLARAEASRPFDLARGPLLRATLLGLGGEEHALLFTLHHIISDGWSTGVLVREVSELYTAEMQGRAPVLSELAVQYADYAAWQRAWLAGDVLEAQLVWWRERLAGAPPVLELPTDRPRPRVAGERAGSSPVRLSPETSHALRVLGRAEGATLFMTLLSAWQLLLSRYSGQEDVVVGTPVAGRTRLETEPLIGFFANTLVLRTDLSGGLSFGGLLRRVREATLGAYQHQDLPFEKLVEELAPERSLSHTPLFQVLFALQNAERSALELGGLEVERLGTGDGGAKFDLSLTLGERGEGLRGSLAYRAELWEGTTMERLAGHFGALLAAAVAEPERPVGELPLLGAAEQAQVLEEWNDTARDFPAGCIHELFAAQARRTPDAVAVVHGGRRTTYAELERWANRLAHALRGRGVGPEVRVGVCLSRTPEMIVAVLGILKAGGAYVPLDPAHPRERLGYVLEDAGAALVLSESALAERLPAGGIPVLALDAEREVVAGAPDTPPAGGAGPESLAYVIYTSGSTGRPKGVMVEHRGLANLLLAAGAEFGFREGDVAPALASFAFDIWGFETLVPLVTGGAVRLVPRERVLDVPALLEECRDATVLHAVPALMRQVVDAGRGALPAARRLFVGGDLVPPELLEDMRAAFPRAEIRVLYGPTEGTVLASAQALDGGPVPARPVIGRPLGNVRLYVCGGAGELLPAGIPGELLIAGRGVARGYLGRAGLTAEKFVPDAFSGEPGARLYRTGDRARWRADGTLEFLGRVDFQVKIRGFRIEPGEIEATLERHPGVEQSVVVARGEAGDRLVAYHVGTAEADELRAHLRRGLPEYMVPAAFVALDALPLTPSGKVDRGALPEPGAAPGGDAYEAPRTPTEEILAGIWADVLGLERVGVHDHFFGIGGHSLLATRVVSRIRHDLRVEVPLRAIYESPTLGEFTRAVLEAGAQPRVEMPGAIIARKDIGQIMTGIDDLSEDELNRLLDSLSTPDEA